MKLDIWLKKFLSKVLKKHPGFSWMLIVKDKNDLKVQLFIK